MRKDLPLTDKDIKDILAFEHWMTLLGAPLGEGPWGTGDDEASMVVDEANEAFREGLFSSAEPGSFMLKLRNEEDLDTLIETLEGYIHWLEDYLEGFEEDLFRFSNPGMEDTLQGRSPETMYVHMNGHLSPERYSRLEEQKVGMQEYRRQISKLKPILTKLIKYRYHLQNEDL